jgi:cell division septal protein FtsQ
MKRGLRIALAVTTSGLLLGATVSAPHALRRMDSFRVRRVQVFGTHFLPADVALRTSGISRQSNVFDDFGPWVQALEKHSLIAHARVERELPSTLRIYIEEEQPVALRAKGAAEGAGVGDLVVVAAAGEVLPIDPSAVALDLPIITASTSASASRVGAARVRTALEVLQRVRAAEPVMYGWISEVQPVGAGEVIVRLRSPAGVEALLPASPDSARLRLLRLALADVAARQDINRLLRIDARYRDQIVVALTPKAAN